MDATQPRLNVAWPLLFAVIAGIGFGIFAVVITVARADRVALPGSLVALALYTTFGVFALRGRSWARWALAALAAMNAFACLLAAFVSLDGDRARMEFSPPHGGRLRVLHVDRHRRRHAEPSVGMWCERGANDHQLPAAAGVMPHSGQRSGVARRS